MKRLTALVVIALVLVALHLAAATPVLDNANGGAWKEYIHIPTTAPTTTDAQYLIKINGTNISVFNSTGYLKTSGSCPAFWSYVSPTGDDIRVTNQSSELYFWVKEFNTTTKQAEIWVNLTAGSTEIDIYYGNPKALPSAYNNVSKAVIFYSNGSSLTGWTVSGATVDTTDGLPPPCYKATGGTYAYIKAMPDPTKDYTIHYDANIIPGTTDMCDFFFMTNSTGYGQMFRINAVSTGRAGVGTTTSWTVWNSPSYLIPIESAGVWYHITLDIVGSEVTATVAGVGTVTAPVVRAGGYIAVHGDASWVTGGLFDNILITYAYDPATFGTPVQLIVGKPVPTTVYINATYNAHDITGHLLINNSTTLLTPTFTYIPSTASATGYLGTGSLTVPGLANITIYLDENYTLNTVICNGTAVTPSYLGTTAINGIVYSVYNFTSPSAGLLVVTANVTPDTASGSTPAIYMENTPEFNITAALSLEGVNATYGATVKVAVIQPLTLSSVVYNGTALTIPTPTTEVINGKNYSVYTFTVYNTSSMIVTAEAQNQLYSTVQLYADGSTNFTYLLVGEPFKVVTPVPCNITLEGILHTNTTAVEFTPMSTVTVTGLAYLFNITTLQFGYKSFSVPVVWGHINLTITPPLQVTSGVYSLTYSKVCSPNRLYAGEDRVVVYYMGMLVAAKDIYLNHTNNGEAVAIVINATNISSKCYNITAVSGSRFNITNLHPVIPYGKFAVNHSGEVIITFNNNSPVTVTVEGNQYSYYPPHLYIYGSGNATVTSYYRIKMCAESALGIPMSVTAEINSNKVKVYGLTSMILPVDKYTVKFPQNVLGFVLKNTTLEQTSLNLTNSTTLPTAVYKVPTHITINAYKMSTTAFRFPFPFLPLSVHTKQIDNGTEAHIEGTLYSWYGTPVPNAYVVVKITSLKTGYTITRILSTGSTGTFSTNFTTVPGVNYSIKVTYSGSPVYVGSEKEITVAGGTLPPAPQESTYSTVLILSALITVCVCAVCAAYFYHKKSSMKAMMALEKKGRYFRRVKK